MASNTNKAYELVNISSEGIDNENSIPQGIPMQTGFPHQTGFPQQQHYPQHQMPVYHHQHPQMMPPQYVQHPGPQYTNNPMPYFNGVPQYQVAFTQLSPAQLELNLQACDREIRKYEFTVITNWIMIALQIIGGIIGIAILFGFTTMLDSFCEIPNMAKHQATRNGNMQDFPFSKDDCIDFLDGIGTGIIIFVVVLILVIGSLLIFLHYKGVVAYRERDADKIECMFICYIVLLGMSVLGMNLIGIIGYGYLTYGFHKLKPLVSDLHRIEAQLRNQQANGSQPIYN